MTESFKRVLETTSDRRHHEGRLNNLEVLAAVKMLGRGSLERPLIVWDF